MAEGGVRLVVLQGPDRGRELRVDTARTGDAPGRRTEITIGRQSDRHLRFSDDYVSRRHARIVASTNGLELVDDDSRNGTWHNGTRLEPGVPVPLHDRDELGFGPYTLVQLRLPGASTRRRLSTSSRAKARLPKSAPQPREWFGPYAVSHGLDRGAHDRVDVAARPPDATPLVLKRFDRTLGRAARRRIRDHVEAARGWDHPGIAAIRACGEHNGTLHLVRHHVDGIGVDRLQRTSPASLPPALAAYLIEQVTIPLAHAHERDPAFVQPYLSHRNVLLARTGAVVLINFGLPLTVQMVTGIDDLPPVEARFTAPECAGTAAAPPDARAEVFSLGMMLFELLTGSAVDLAEAAVLRSVDRIHPDVPRALAEIATKALKLHAARRYDSPADMGAALRAALRRLAPDFGPASAAHWVGDKLGS